MGRQAGKLDNYWVDRLILLLVTVLSIQEERHTASMRELGKACGVSRQTVANWLKMAEELGYIDMHNGQPRAVQLKPEGRRLARRYEYLNQDVKGWWQMREGLRKQLCEPVNRPRSW